MLGKLHKVKGRNFLPALIKGIFFFKAIYVLGINELEQNNSNPFAATKDLVMSWGLVF